MNEYDVKQIKLLRDRISDVIPEEFTDFDILRWLQGHGYNLDSIEPNLRHHFRVLSCFDSVKSEFQNEVMSKYWPYGFIGSVGSGQHFAYIETVGTLDAEGIMKSVQKTHIVFHNFYIMEEIILKSMRKYESESGCQSGINWILDGDGLSMNAKLFSLVAGPYKLLLNILMKHYAEVIQKCIFVNAPASIVALYNLIKPILPERSRQKFVISGPNWRSELLQYCHADTLPVHYGGALVDENGDPKCRTKIIFTSKVPESYYWFPSDADPKKDDMTLLTVNPRKCSFITVELTEDCKFLEWFYYCDNDWGFGVFYTESESESVLDKMEMVFPQIDHLSGPVIVAEKDKILCKKRGFYKLWFNNKFSILTKLQVRYKINVKG